MASVTITGVTKSFGNVTALQRNLIKKFEDGEFITLLGHLVVENNYA